MNVILCSHQEYDAKVIVLDGERAEHVRCVHRAKVGDPLRVGVLNGAMGQATVRVLRRHHVELEIQAPFTQAPPPAHPLTLCVAMCRPPSLQKVLMHATAMGVKNFHVFHTRRSEKSFWDSHALEAPAIEVCLRLGLEQARDTMLPRIDWHRRFRPFAEDLLAPRMAKETVWLADPIATGSGFVQAGKDLAPGIVVVGPEGGFVPFEREMLFELGAKGVSLGPRILRVEVATVGLLSAYLAHQIEAVAGSN